MTADPFEIISNIDRYRYTHLLMAHSQMKRRAFDEAVAYWSELLEYEEDDAKEQAYIHTELAECWIKLGKSNYRLNKQRSKSIASALNNHKDLNFSATNT